MSKKSQNKRHTANEGPNFFKRPRSYVWAVIIILAAMITAYAFGPRVRDVMDKTPYNITSNGSVDYIGRDDKECIPFACIGSPKDFFYQTDLSPEDVVKSLGLEFIGKTATNAKYAPYLLKARVTNGGTVDFYYVENNGNQVNISNKYKPLSKKYVLIVPSYSLETVKPDIFVGVD